MTMGEGCGSGSAVAACFADGGEDFRGHPVGELFGGGFVGAEGEFVEGGFTDEGGVLFLFSKLSVLIFEGGREFYDHPPVFRDTGKHLVSAPGNAKGIAYIPCDKPEASVFLREGSDNVILKGKVDGGVAVFHNGLLVFSRWKDSATTEG